MKKLIFVIFFILLRCSFLFADDDIFRIKDVIFDGLQNVKLKTVRSEIQMKKGKVYATTIAREDLRTILGLGYFDNAELSVDKDNKIVKFKVTEKPYIRNIFFKGNKQFSSGKLKGEITIKEKSFYNFIDLEESKRKILTLYKNKGYSDCKMEVYPTKDYDTNMMTITFLLTENNKMLINDLYIEGIKSFKNKKIKKLAKTKKKKVFKEETLKMDINSIIKFYRNNGFMDCSLDEPKITYNEERTKMNITLNVNEGTRYKIGRIYFDGNTVISSKNLLKLSSIKKDEIFNQDKILELINKIYENYSNRGYLHSSIVPNFLKNNETTVKDKLSPQKSDKEFILEKDIYDISIQLADKINTKLVNKYVNKLKNKLEYVKSKVISIENEALIKKDEKQNVLDKIEIVNKSISKKDYLANRQIKKLEKKKIKLEKKLEKIDTKLSNIYEKIKEKQDEVQNIKSSIQQIQDNVADKKDYVLADKQIKKLEKNKIKLEKILSKEQKKRKNIVEKEKEKVKRHEQKLAKQNDKIQQKIDNINIKLKDKERFKLTNKQIKKLESNITVLENKLANNQKEKNAENIVDISFNIQENNIVYVGNIYIDGLVKTKDNTIRREILLKNGDVFASGKVRRSMEKIYNLGFIDGAEPNISQTGNPDIMNLAFSITEGKPGMITAGAGYSSVDKFVGSIQLQHMNLFGKAQKLNLLWEFGARRQNYEIDWTEPWFLNKPMSLGLSLFNIERLRDYHNTSDAYREGRTGGSVSISPRLDDKISLLFGYTYEHVRLFDIQDNDLSEEILADPDLAKDRTSSIKAHIVYDTRDYIFDASRGARYSYGINLAGGPFGGNVNYVRNSLKATWFFPTFWKFVLSFNINTGWIESYGNSNDVPLYEKYYVGGADTIRGYKYRTEVGPYNGGKVMTVANVEYKFPIVQENKKTILQGAFFYDIGGTWKDVNHINFCFGTDNELTNSYYLKSGVGFGIRFATPVFPLRLDWGYGLNHKRGEDLQQFYFTIGNAF